MGYMCSQGNFQAAKPGCGFCRSGLTITQIEDVNQPANNGNASCFPKNFYEFHELQTIHALLPTLDNFLTPGLSLLNGNFSLKGADI